MSLSFQVHTLRECLATERGFRPTITGASLGFRPSRVRSQQPCPGLLPDSSHALHEIRRRIAELTGAPEYRSALAWSRPSARRNAHRPEQPSEGSCTVRFLSMRSRRRPGCFFHLSPGCALLSAHRRS